MGIVTPNRPGGGGLPVGTGPGTVAAGDDSRIVNLASLLNVDLSNVINLLWTGQSNTVGVGEGGDTTIEANIQVWNDVMNVYQTAVYGNYPLNMKSATGAQAVNAGIALLNEMRRSGKWPASTTFRWHMIAQGGKSRSNFIAFKQNTNGQTQGQFALAAIDAMAAAAGVTKFHIVGGIHGEADSTTTTADAAQVGGAWTTTSWPFGNSATGLVSGPDFPQTAVDAIVAAGGFNTTVGYQVATDAFVAALRKRSYIPAKTPFLWGEIHGYWNAAAPLRNDYYTLMSQGIDPYVGVVPTAGLKASAETGNSNHWDGPSLNILGKRFLAKLNEMIGGSSGGGLNDLYGNKVATRYELNLLGNVNDAGVSNSTDGASYTVSLEEIRNGIAIRAASAVGSPTKIILPNGAYTIGAVDLELYVSSISNGSTYLLSLQPLYDCPLQATRVTLYGLNYYQYEVNNVSQWRLTSAFGAWRFVLNPRVTGLQRSSNFGFTSVGTNCYTADLSAAPVTGNTITFNYTLSGTTNNVTASFTTTADQALADLALNLQNSLLTVQSGWSVYNVAGQNALSISGPSGQTLTFNAGSSGTSGGASQPTWTWRPNIFSIPTWMAGIALLTVSGLSAVVLPSSNASTPGVYYVQAAADVGIDCWSNAQIYDVNGLSIVGSIGATPPFILPANYGGEFQALTASRWHLTGGTVTIIPTALRQGGTLGVNPYRIVLSGALTTGQVLTIQASLNGSALAQVQVTYNGSSQATLAAAATALQAALNAVVAGWTVRLVAPLNVLQIDGPTANTITLTSGTVTGGTPPTVSLDSGTYSVSVPQSRTYGYDIGTATSTVILPNPNNTFGRIMYRTTSQITLSTASGSIYDRNNNAQSSITVPAGVTILLESALSSRWVIIGGSYNYIKGTQNNNTTVSSVTVSPGFSEQTLIINQGATVANLTVNLDPNRPDGYTFTIYAIVAVTSLTLSGWAFQTTAPTSLAAGSVTTFRWSTALAKAIRLA